MHLKFISLMMLLILTARDVVAAQENYGCLSVDDGSYPQGHYDLTTGHYTELSNNGNEDISVSPDGLYTANSQNQQQFVITAKTGKPPITIDVSDFSLSMTPQWSPNSRYLMLWTLAKRERRIKNYHYSREAQ
jgi:hypothetical protein